MRPRSTNWHISGWRAVILAPVLVPLALLISLLPIKQTSDRTVEDVAGFLRDFAEESGGDWDWDDFTSVPITLPELEAIRAEAALLDFPLTSDGRAKLHELLAKAEQLAKRSR